MAEEGEAGSAVHLPFDEFDLVVDALGAPVVPGQGDGGFDGGAFAFQAGGVGVGPGVTRCRIRRVAGSRTGCTFSTTQIARARTWREGTPGLHIVHAEACHYLDTTDQHFDAIYSVWGAAFTDPDLLFPLVRARLNPGGVFAFAHAEPLEGLYGPEGMYGNGFNGPKLTVLRWSHTPEQWGDLLKRHGFTTIDADILAAPDPGHVGTPMVRAYSPHDQQKAMGAALLKGT